MLSETPHQNATSTVPIKLAVFSLPVLTIACTGRFSDEDFGADNFPGGGTPRLTEKSDVVFGHSENVALERRLCSLRFSGLLNPHGSFTKLVYWSRLEACAKATTAFFRGVKICGLERHYNPRGKMNKIALFMSREHDLRVISSSHEHAKLTCTPLNPRETESRCLCREGVNKIHRTKVDTSRDSKIIIMSFPI